MSRAQNVPVRPMPACKSVHYLEMPSHAWKEVRAVSMLGSVPEGLDFVPIAASNSGHLLTTPGSTEGVVYTT